MSDEREVPTLRANDVLDKDVFDLNGEKLGHVALAREYEGHLVSFDVQLTRAARRAHRAPDAIATLMSEDVVATDFDVSMNEDADHLLSGGLPVPIE